MAPSSALAGVLGGLGPDGIALLEAFFSAYTTGSGTANLEAVTLPEIVGKTFTLGPVTLPITAK